MEQTPFRYLSYVFALLEYHRIGSYAEGIPLVINTSGWVQGMGLDLLLSALNFAQPSHVVQLRSEETSLRTSITDLPVALGEMDNTITPWMEDRWQQKYQDACRTKKPTRFITMCSCTEDRHMIRFVI